MFDQPCQFLDVDIDLTVVIRQALVDVHRFLKQQSDDENKRNNKNETNQNKNNRCAQRGPMQLFLHLLIHGHKEPRQNNRPENGIDERLHNVEKSHGNNQHDREKKNCLFFRCFHVRMILRLGIKIMDNTQFIS